MKDYNKYAVKISKMCKFCDIHQCGSPSKHHQVNLFFQLSEPYLLGFKFYICYSFGEWNIDYSIDKTVQMRADMKTIRGIKSDKEMLEKVEEVIQQYRKQVA